MKRLLSVLLSILLAFSMMSLIACGNSNGGGGNSSSKCANCTRFEDETVYKQNENEMQVYVGKPCKKCGFVSNPEKVIEIDYVVSDSNDVTTAQEDADTKGKDCVILLKAKDYEKIYAIARYNGATHIIFESGSTIKNIDIQPDAYDVTIENANFDLDPNAGIGGGVHFAGGGNSWENKELVWTKVTIKNSRFYGLARIERAWNNGIVEDLTVENCKFENNITTNGKDWTPVFIGEVFGATFKNNSFKDVEWCVIRLGYTGKADPGLGINGKLLIEGNYFENVLEHRIIQLVNVNTDAEVYIQNNTFNDTNRALSVSIKEGVVDYTVEFGANIWPMANAPDDIPGATYYNPGDQIYP